MKQWAKEATLTWIFSPTSEPQAASASHGPAEQHFPPWNIFFIFCRNLWSMARSAKIVSKDVKQVLVCSAFIVWNECVYLVKGAAGDRRPLRAVYISNTQLLLRLTSFPPQRIKIPPPGIWPHPPLSSELHPTFLGSLSPRSPGSKKCFFLFQLIFVCYPNKELLRLQV